MVPFTMFLILLVILWLTHWWLKQRKLPPGPFSVPLFGILPFTGWKLPSSEDFEKPEFWKYGDIARLDYGLITIYVIYDYELCKELFNTDTFSGR